MRPKRGKKDMKPIPPDVITPNAVSCTICDGPGDKYAHCYQCRDCGALGDFIVGIFTPTREECE